MIFKATISNKDQPDHGVVTIPFPVLNRLVAQSVNVDELDYNSFKSQQTHLDNRTDFGTQRTEEELSCVKKARKS